MVLKLLRVQTKINFDLVPMVGSCSVDPSNLNASHVEIFGCDHQLNLKPDKITFNFSFYDVFPKKNIYLPEQADQSSKQSSGSSVGDKNVDVDSQSSRVLRLSDE